MKKNFQYQEFETTKLCGVINQAIYDLDDNTDLEEILYKRWMITHQAFGM